MPMAIPQPAMAWNSPSVRTVAMTNTRLVSDETNIADLCDNTVSVMQDFRRQTGKQLFHLVINCHGAYAYGTVSGRELQGSDLLIGRGIHEPSQTVPFRKLAPYVRMIHLVACGAGAITLPGGLKEATPHLPPGAGDGNLLCGAMAKNAQAWVYASKDYVEVDRSKELPPFHIPNWQGSVQTWHPDGSDGGTVEYPRIPD